MPHLPQSDDDRSSIDLATVPPEIRQLFDNKTIVATDTHDQTIGSAMRSLKEQLEHTARHPTVAGQESQDVLPITPDVDRLRSRLQRLAVSPSPVTRLPPEILAYIFELCVVRGIESTPVPAQGTFCFAQVCKLWRAIAESDPRLWTSIHLYFPDSHENREEDVLRVKPMFDLHLKRSGTLPISLTFTDHRIYDSTTENLISLLVDRLRTHARRWKRISLQLSSCYFSLLFTFTSCDLSSLEHLYISGDAHPPRFVTTLTLNLESATNLKSFSYSRPGHALGDSIQIHWESLAEVSFEFSPHIGASATVSTSRQFSHLAQCQNITTCSLGITRPNWRPFQNGDPTITLPCLQTLRVRRLSPYSHAHTTIDPLILPQLQTLEIDASVLVGWNQHWHDHNFSELLARSRCTLHHLSIQDVDFPNHELVRCLALSPELTSFCFIPCPRSQNISGIIRRLDVSGGQTRTRGHRQGRVANGLYIPRLREITLASSVEGCLDLMMEMFRSRVGARARAAGVATLRRVRVIFFDMCHDTDVDRVSSVPGARLGKLARFRADLARWVSENKDASGKEDEDRKLVASVVVDSPYLAEYIDVQQGLHRISS